jgi:hypothetical protein
MKDTMVLEKTKRYLYSGVNLNTSHKEQEFAFILSRLQEMAKDEPEKLEALRQEFLGWYLAYCLKSGKAKGMGLPDYHKSKRKNYNRNRKKKNK